MTADGVKSENGQDEKYWTPVVQARLAAAIASWGSRADFAKATGMSTSHVSALLTKPNEPSITKVARMARVLDLTIDELLTGDEARRPRLVAEVRGDKLVNVPLIAGVTVSAGPGTPNEQAEMLQPGFTLPIDWLRQNFGNVDQLRLMVVSGDSMEPTFSDGRVLLVQLDPEARRDGIYVIRLDGQLLVKRLQILPEGVNVISDNRLYDPIFVQRGDEEAGYIEDRLVVVGRAVFSFQPT